MVVLGRGVRIRGLLCRSFGAAYCYVADLGREAEDMWVVMPQFCGGRLRIWGLLCGSFKMEV